ncbi:hypothetical protein EAH_00065800 [Eimeria acervulina]|uniref:Uncharacterized protein n=1 Tax=Eimeria acervulina TaxID=5801 RepID=U6GSN6_EIMAC|nr:hypothetical protein EAH_00065800 [Eimeria acervulina]CDI82298.1 hypothetical protein EAH_00065800 [Eimeria acervulina]
MGWAFFREVGCGAEAIRLVCYGRLLGIGEEWVVWAMVWVGRAGVLCLEVYRAALLLGMVGIQKHVRAWWEGEVGCGAEAIRLVCYGRLLGIGEEWVVWAMVWVGQAWALCLEVYRAALLRGMVGIQKDVRAWWEGYVERGMHLWGGWLRCGGDPAGLLQASFGKRTFERLSGLRSMSTAKGVAVDMLSGSCTCG